MEGLTHEVFCRDLVQSSSCSYCESRSVLASVLGEFAPSPWPWPAEVPIPEARLVPPCRERITCIPVRPFPGNSEVLPSAAV